MAFKWYILSSRSGYEDRVVKEITVKLKKFGYAEKVKEIFLPKKRLFKIRNGKKIEELKTCFPGYIFIHMSDDSDLFLYLPGLENISGFLGIGNHCTPIEDSEVEAIKRDLEANNEEKELELSSYQIGDNIKIVDNGPFFGFSGVISDKLDNNKLKVSVLIFGRATDLQLNIDDVEKIGSDE